MITEMVYTPLFPSLVILLIFLMSDCREIWGEISRLDSVNDDEQDADLLIVKVLLGLAMNQFCLKLSLPTPAQSMFWKVPS